MEKRFCKKCGKELPEERNDKLCEECRKKKNNLVSKILVGVGTAGVAIAAILASTADKNNDIDNNRNQQMKNDGLASAGGRHHDYYHGYVPVGCSACGGNYPYCKDGCPLFDDY